YELDPINGISTGYARGFLLDFERFELHLTAFADIMMPISLLDFNHYRIRLGNRMKIKNFGKWHILNRLTLLDTSAENDLFFGHTVSLDESILAGYFENRWHASFEAGFTKFLVSYIKHNSEWFRVAGFNEAKSGWYKSMGGNFTFGINGGYQFNDTVETTLKIHIRKTQSFNSIDGPPVYGAVGINFYYN
ncbi:hypothetical protein ACFL5P_03735, partial [candidate division KSB1 bacterium]